MQYGLCHLSIIPIRENPEETSAMVTQLLYGEPYKIKDTRKYWSRIQGCFDGSEGWVRNNQLHQISESVFSGISETAPLKLSVDFIANIATGQGLLSPILFGSRIDTSAKLNHHFEGETLTTESKKTNLPDTALHYLNAPFLQGGRTPFGIDASGFTQMVYKINGFFLYRSTEKQATQGEPLSFIEESEPGDLAFFDNKEGMIDHVGIILKDNYIIHAFGHVRIDRIDHTGIFNVKDKKYSHQLRVIKKVI